MTWARFDDRARENLKVRRAQTSGLALWAASIMWCCEHQTDGRVPKELLPDVWRPLGESFDHAAVARLLVEEGLFEDAGDAYVVHDFLEYNPSKEEGDEKKRRAAERARRYRKRRSGAVTRDATHDGTGDGQRDEPRDDAGDEVRDETRTSQGQRHASRTHPRPVPSRTRPEPDPTPDARAGAGEGGVFERVEEAERLLLRGYADRYGAAAGELWMGHGRAATDIMAAARWAAAKGPELIPERVERLLDGVFADAWMTKNRWPWAVIARDPARFGAPAPAKQTRVSGYLPPSDGEGFSEDDIPAIGPGGRQAGHG